VKKLKCLKEGTRSAMGNEVRYKDEVPQRGVKYERRRGGM